MSNTPKIPLSDLKLIVKEVIRESLTDRNKSDYVGLSLKPIGKVPEKGKGELGKGSGFLKALTPKGEKRVNESGGNATWFQDFMEKVPEKDLKFIEDLMRTQSLSLPEAIRDYLEMYGANQTGKPISMSPRPGRMFEGMENSTLLEIKESLFALRNIANLLLEPKNRDFPVEPRTMLKRFSQIASETLSVLSQIPANIGDDATLLEIKKRLFALRDIVNLLLKSKTRNLSAEPRTMLKSLSQSAWETLTLFLKSFESELNMTDFDPKIEEGAGAPDPMAVLSQVTANIGDDATIANLSPEVAKKKLTVIRSILNSVVAKFKQGQQPTKQVAEGSAKTQTSTYKTAPNPSCLTQKDDVDKLEPSDPRVTESSTIKAGKKGVSYKTQGATYKTAPNPSCRVQTDDKDRREPGDPELTESQEPVDETAYKVQGPSYKTFDDSPQLPDAVNDPENA